MTEFAPLTTARVAWWHRWWGIILILFVGITVIFGSWFAYTVYASVKKIKSGELKPLTKFNTEFTAGKLGGAAPVGKNVKGVALFRPENPTVGSGAHTIVQFGDFECPFTAKEFPIIRPFMEKVLNVQFVYRDFPLTAIHTRAFDASHAALCAKDQGKYWQYHDQLFLNQKDLSAEALARYAKTIGLDAAVFATCMKNQTHKEQIARDIQDGTALGVRGTPTFFIDGIKVEGAVPTDGWREIFKRLGAKLSS